MPRDYKVYLEDILVAVQKIHTFTFGYSKEMLAQDAKTRDAMIRNLEIIGEAVKHLPEEVRLQKGHVDWKKIAGMRDILAHEYFGIDDDIQKKIPFRVSKNRLIDSILRPILESESQCSESQKIPKFGVKVLEGGFRHMA